MSFYHRHEHDQQRLGLAVEAAGEQLLRADVRRDTRRRHVTRVPGSSHACGRPCGSGCEQLQPASNKAASSAKARQNDGLLIVFFLFLVGIANGESRKAAKMPLTKTIPKLLMACVVLNTNMPSVNKVVIIARVTASSDVSGVPRGLLKNSV